MRINVARNDYRRFTVTSPHTGKTLTANTIMSLEKAWLRHHAQAEIVLPSDPLAQMHDLHCRQTNDPGCVAPKGARHRLSWRDVRRFLGVFTGWLADGFQIVPDATYRARLATCDACPMRTRVVHGCWGCAAIGAMVRQIARITGRDLHIDPKDTDYCAACSCVVKIKALAPAHLYANDGVPYHEDCWVKKEQESS